MGPIPTPSEQNAKTSTVVVGRVVAASGVRGEVRVEVLSDVPHRYAPESVLYVDGRAFHVQKRRIGPSGMVVKFEGVDTRDAAESLRGLLLCVPEAEVPTAAEGTYYHYQLLGARVISVDGEDLGEVTEILETGANDVYVVSGPRGEILVPAIAGVVVSVDVRGGRVVVDLPGEM